MDDLKAGSIILQLGAGSNTRKRFDTKRNCFYQSDFDMAAIVSCDITQPLDYPVSYHDYAHDLNQTPWPMPPNRYDQVHAYEILEHLGLQGDFVSFFAHFAELWRILKPNGLLFASCPNWDSRWTWGDPGHTRVINHGSLVFLQRKEYEKQLGKTAMTDYRHLLMGDWNVEHMSYCGESFCFVMRALK